MEKIAQQMIGFQKTLFENAYNAMILVQDQTEKMADSLMDQMTWMPEDGKKAVKDSVKMYKKARDDYKKAVDDGFSKLDSLFAGK